MPCSERAQDVCNHEDLGQGIVIATAEWIISHYALPHTKQEVAV